MTVLYHLTILSFQSKCKNVLHFRMNMRKAKTDIEQIWFLFLPTPFSAPFFWQFFLFVFLKIRVFQNTLEMRVQYGNKLVKHACSVLFCLLSLAGEKRHTYMIRLCRCEDFDLVTPLTMLIDRKWFLTIVPNIGPSSSST